MKLFQGKHVHCVTSSRLVILVLLVSALYAQAQLPLLPQDVTVFSSAQNVSNSAGTSTAYQIAVGPTGDIYVVWLDNTLGYYAVFFSSSVDKGLTFSQPQNLSNDPAGSGWPEIAVDSAGNINVVWETPYSSNGTAFFSRSSDRGGTFSAPIAFANNVNGTPNIAVDSTGNIYLSWTDSPSHNIFSGGSSDGGATFSVPVQVSNRPPVGSVGIPLIAVDSRGSVDVLWEDCFDYCHVWFNHSSDRGSTFSPTTSVSGTLEFPSQLGMALDSAGDINAVWNTVPFGYVFLSRSVDGGLTFSSTTPMTNNTRPFSDPCCAKVAVDPAGGIDMVWTDRSFGNIVFNRTNDDGLTFSTTKFTNAGYPQIAVDSRSGINLVWASASEILFSRSSDLGTTFSSPQNVSGNGGISDVPLIAIDSADGINVVWGSNSPGNQDVFFSHGVVLRPPSLPVGLQ